MDLSLQFVSKEPSACSATEISNFMALVMAAEQVPPTGLETRVRRADQLVFLLEDGQVRGIAALKNPHAQYRRRIASSSGAAIPVHSFPYELGWVFVLPKARGNGHGLRLSQVALTSAGDDGVFATSRADNTPMHKVLTKLGFARAGEAYPSSYGNHYLELFTRARNYRTAEAAVRLDHLD